VTFFASLVLVFVLVIRPQEIWPALNALHLLEVFTALVVIGLLVELALRRQKHLYSPQLPFLGAFIFLCYFLTALNLGIGRGMTLGTNRALIPAVFMLAVMYGARTLTRLKTVLWLLLLLCVFVSAVAVHQGNVPPVCIEKVTNEDGEVNPDPETSEGRQCSLPGDCRDPSREEVEWACEHLGLFKTFSTGRRVRWRGQLDDPNELSVFIGAVIPLLFAMGMPTRKSGSELGTSAKAFLIALALVMLGLGLYAVILSQSRGGQLVVATVFGIYFVARFRTKGLIFALIFSLPVLLLGGRDDAGAEDSSAERFELLYQGISLVLANAVKGVGIDQFPDRVQASVHLTAHNSYVLTPAELGFSGFFAWTGILWTSFKIPLTVLKRSAEDLTPALRTLAMALVVSFAGIGVGIFFLSFTYKQLLFVWFGLAGALYGVMKDVDPTFEVKVGKKDLFGIVFFDFGIICFIYAYTRLKGGGGG
jgi:hypothetical protein